MASRILGKAIYDAIADRREDRRNAIVDAAESLFLEHGFERVSLAAIIKQSGGSLATVYELFGNKQGLLRAVVDRSRQEKFADLTDAACEMESAADALRMIARRLNEHMVSPRAIAMMRIVIAEALRDPEFARDFHRDVHLSFVGELAECFRAWNAEGKAEIDDPEAAAELYLASVLCDAQLKAMIRTDAAPPGEAQIEWRLAPFITYFKVR